MSSSSSEADLGEVPIIEDINNDDLFNPVPLAEPERCQQEEELVQDNETLDRLVINEEPGIIESSAQIALGAPYSVNVLHEIVENIKMCLRRVGAPASLVAEADVIRDLWEKSFLAGEVRSYLLKASRHLVCQEYLEANILSHLISMQPDVKWLFIFLQKVIKYVNDPREYFECFGEQ